MNKIEEFFEIFDIVFNTKKSQNILCGSGLAAVLFDHMEFFPLQMQAKTFNTPFFHCGAPYTVGCVHNLKLNIDPELSYNDMNVYDPKGKIIYNFNKFKLMELL